MKIDIKVSSSREKSIGMDLKEAFPSYVDEMNEYSFHVSISVSENGSRVATVHGLVFDENKILNEHENIVNIADIHSADALGAISSLVKSSIYKQESDENLIFESPYICYIETLYVYPQYRGKSIGKYIFNNIYNIFLYSLNIHTRCLVICPKPQEPVDKHSWVNSLDDDGRLKKIMLNVLKGCGYKRIGKTEFFAINCMT